MRVVGRLPDIPGAREPDYLVRLLRHAARARPAPRREYARWFALTAQSWLCSTRISLERIYGPIRRSEMHVSPGVRDGPLTAAKLAGRMHFVNCHGGPFEATFQGEMEGIPLPRTEALATRTLKGKVPRGAVLAVECCYGTHVFDPHDRRAGEPGRLGIALEYLRQGAHAVFGSTSTAYGGIYNVENADILCGRFMQRVLAGASVGRAALEAQQDFLSFSQGHDPTQLKTLAQFCVLGDPSIHPVRREEAAPRRGVRNAFRARQARRLATRLRRENLRRMGQAILASFPMLGNAERPTARQAHRHVAKVARALGYSDPTLVREAIRIFDLSIAAADRRPVSRGEGAGIRRVIVGMRRVFDRHHVVIAQVEGSRTLAIRELSSR